MSVINISNVIMPNGDEYDFVITIDDGDSGKAETHGLKEMGSFSIGSDNDKDVIFYPSNLEIVMQVKQSDSYNLQSKWYEIYNLLQTYDAVCEVFKNGTSYFYGNIYKGDLDGSYKNGELNITIADPIGDLEDVNPMEDFPEIPLGATINYVSNHILALLAKVNPKFTSPSQIECYSGYQAQADVIDPFTGAYYVGGWVNFGFYNDWLFNNDKFTTGIDLLRALLNMFGCIGVFVPGHKFYIIPRWQGSASLTNITITDQNVSNDPEPFFVRKMEGLKIDANTGSKGVYESKEYGIVERDESGTILNSDLVEEIKIESPVGLLPEGNSSFSNLFIYVSDFILGIGNGDWFSARFDRVRDGSSSIWTSLWATTASKTWELIKNNRFGYSLDIKGLVNFKDRYIFNNMNMRIKLIEYDPVKNISEVKLLSSTASIDTRGRLSQLITDGGFEEGFPSIDTEDFIAENITIERDYEEPYKGSWALKITFDNLTADYYSYKCAADILAEELSYNFYCALFIPEDNEQFTSARLISGYRFDDLTDHNGENILDHNSETIEASEEIVIAETSVQGAWIEIEGDYTVGARDTKEFKIIFDKGEPPLESRAEDEIIYLDELSISLI